MFTESVHPISSVHPKSRRTARAGAQPTSTRAAFRPRAGVGARLWASLGTANLMMLLRVLITAATLAPVALAAAGISPASTAAHLGALSHAGDPDRLRIQRPGTRRLGAGRVGQPALSRVTLAAVITPLRPSGQLPAHSAAAVRAQEPVSQSTVPSAGAGLARTGCPGSLLLGDPTDFAQSAGGIEVNVSLGSTGRGWGGCVDPSADPSAGDSDHDSSHHHRGRRGDRDCGCPGQWSPPRPPLAHPGAPSAYSPGSNPGYGNPAAWPTYPTTGYPGTGYPAYPSTGYPGYAPYSGYPSGTGPQPWSTGANPCASYGPGSTPATDSTGRWVCTRPTSSGTGFGVGIGAGGW
jgi:hypothetical protein